MKRLSLPTVIVGIKIVIGSAAAAGWASTPAQPGPASSPALPWKSPYKKRSVPVRVLETLVRAHEPWAEYRGNPDAKRTELCQADLSRAALAGITLERTKLPGALLASVTGLTQAQLDAACAHEQRPSSPERIRPTPCGPAKKGARP